MVLRHQIHVLDLWPPSLNEDENAMLKCDVRPICLTDDGASEKYEALSYVWGDQSRKVPIMVSDRQFDVTRSLQAALQQIRLQDRKRTLYVDQICIDQSDPKHKAEQVPLMGGIFSSCSRCLVWLGEIPHDKGISIEDAEAAFEILRYMAAGAAVTEETLDSLHDAPSCLTNYTLPAYSSLERVMKAMSAMTRTENPWWNRIWTVQEAVLPKKVLLLWGPLSLSWETLRLATQVWTGSAGVCPQLISDHVLGFTPYCDILSELMTHSIWLDISSSRRECPLFLIRRWRERLATDPRDKLYGLLGLLRSQGTLPSIDDCNYERSTAEVYSLLTIDLIANENCLRPLVSDPRLETDLATEEIPSWALDIGAVTKYGTDWYHIYGYWMYNADDGLGSMDSEALCAAAAESGNKTLKLNGIIVDVVQGVSQGLCVSRLGYHAISTSILHSIQDWYDDATRWFRGNDDGEGHRHHHHHHLLETFTRLMLGDLIRDREQWPERRINQEDIESVGQLILDDWDDEPSDEVLRTIYGMVRNQVFFVTRNGRLGLGHLETEPGDQVWIFRGGNVPFTLRRTRKLRGDEVTTVRDEADSGDEDEEDDDYHSFIGRTYVQGIMRGEALRDGLVKLDDERPVWIR